MPARPRLWVWSAPVDTIHQLQPPDTVTVFRMPSGKSNGLGLDTQGRLIASEHDNRRVSRTPRWRSSEISGTLSPALPGLPTTSKFLRPAAFVGSMKGREQWRSRMQLRTVDARSYSRW